MHARADCPLCTAASEAHPLLVAAQRHTVAFLGDNQGCRGWCVVVTRAHIEHLDHLAVETQAEIFAEAARVARAVRRVFPDTGAGSAPPRINYECLGNQVAHVHWHLVPRHADDPTPRLPVWGWGAEVLRGAMTEQERKDLAAKIRGEVARVPLV